MITIQNLSKAYGAIHAVQDINLEISRGEIVGLLGPNGAGKTTLIKILTGYLQPDQGEVFIDMIDVVKSPHLAQERIGYLPENAPLYPELSVYDYLQMMADLRHIPEAEQEAVIREAVISVKLEDDYLRPIKQLSKGMRQRVGLAQAILHKPKLLILDEPTVGLDPTQLVEIRSLLKELAKKSTILFSTHILPEVEMLCDRVVILLNGKLKADANLADLAKTNHAILILEENQPEVRKELLSIDGVRAVEVQDSGPFGAYQIQGSTDFDLTPQIYRLASQKGWPVRELRRDTPTLESVFNDLAVAGER